MNIDQLKEWLIASGFNNQQEAEAAIQAMEIWFAKPRSEITMEQAFHWFAVWIKAKQYYESLQPKGRPVPHVVAPGNKFS